jgi:hypothetical protein
MMFVLFASGLVNIVNHNIREMMRFVMRSGMNRERMPRKRRSRHYEFSGGITVTVGEYDDGRVGELFIDLGKEGSDVSGWANAFAICLSLGLQHGIPLKKFVHTFKDMKFGHCQEGSSIPDLTMRMLEKEYCNG